MTAERFDPAAGDLERQIFAREVRPPAEPSSTQGPAEARAGLRRVVGIQDERFLDRLVTIGVRPDTALALRLVPLIFVAWADGTMHEHERKAILQAAEQRGLVPDSDASRLLEGWLARAPDPKLLVLWKRRVRALWSCFTADERWQMRQNLLRTAREVAEAAGSLLGLTSGISGAERAVLADLERELD